VKRKAGLAGKTRKVGCVGKGVRSQAIGDRKLKISGWVDE